MKLYDNSEREFTIAPECPWYKEQQQMGAPNVNWCEPTTCAYINEPANTWSNLGFLLVGLLILKKFSTSSIKNFGTVVIVMGLFSGVYHATNNFGSQLLDFLGMALMMSYLFAFHLGRVQKVCQFSFVKRFSVVLFLNLTVLYSLIAFNVPVQMLLMINAVPLLALDIYCGFKNKSLKTYSAFLIGFFILILAQVSAQVDLKRIYCEPENVVLHGHVVWHLLCAVAMYFIAVHMDRQKKFSKS